ncbi:MAG TPA: signal recognition particle-docking protein FtsY [Deltaproteobacteria bacterium]|nr:signal recognition particle-docking protein FtsY [Deltaproteobacteria bacterium]HQI81643.1 signal recognition particle-docking protein FtsY [Deltaproteobacteria bacterium]
MQYTFSKHDYAIFILSYVFFFLFIADIQGLIPVPVLAGIPSWVYLATAVIMNLWVLPLPGIHPRLPGKPEAPALPVPAEAPALPEKPMEPAPRKVPPAPTPEEKLGRGLSKTHKGFIDRITAVFKRSSAIDGGLLSELEETLVGTDIGVKTAYALFESIQKKASSLNGPESALNAIREEVEGILSKREAPLTIPGDVKPYVIMVTGVNGSGKTTTIAKIAYQLKNEGKSVIIASGDTFRAAAIEQLEHWANKVGSDFVKSQEGADPSSVAFDGLQAAISRGHDVLIIDTAGRLHTKENLMEELKKTQRVLGKKLQGAPHEILLVLDATIGQNAIEQTRQFNNALGVSGIALTKLDGSSKGGVIVGIANEFQIPIRFIGVGEDMDDLQPFHAKSFVNALFLDN